MSGVPEDIHDLVDEALRHGVIDVLSEVHALYPDLPGGPPLRPGGWLRDAVYFGDADAALWLIGQGAPLDLDDGDGFPALHLVLDRTRARQHDILRALLAAGADPNARGINDWTALHHAAVRDDRKAMDILLRAGADRELRTRIDNYATPEEEARQLGHAASADFLRRWTPEDRPL